jgi:hypothetical protein
MRQLEGCIWKKRDRRKSESSEKALPLSMPILPREGKEYIPTPPRAMTKLFDATCGASCVGHLEKTGEAARATIPALAAAPTA